MALYHEQIDDFIELTLNRIKKNEWVDISMPLQEYTFGAKWFKSKKKPEKGGTRMEWKLRVDNQGNARHSGLYGVDNLGRKNVMTHGHQEWSKQVGGYTYDIDEDAFQSDEETLIREMILNEQGLYNDFFALMETSMWTAPSSSALKIRPPSGIPFWIQKNSTLGFTGGNPDGFSEGAGSIDTDAYAKWKNYTGPYVQISRDDLIEKIINAMDFCYFKAPAPYPEIGGGEASWGLYTVHSVLAVMRRLLQRGNDDLGPDVAAFSGQVLVRSTPLTWVPALSETESDAYDSSAPFYGVNWKKFEYFFKTNRNMILHPPKEAPNQSSVRKRLMTNWGNFVCYDRRQGGFVFYVAS